MENPLIKPLINRPYPLPALMPNQYYEGTPNPDSIGKNELFFVETSDPFDKYSYRLSKLIYNGKTDFQDVLIADTYNFGRILALDGSIQSAEDDEALYHEMLVQPAMLSHPCPRRVLIIGGGEGAALREVLAHNSVKSVTMGDLDKKVVELCRKHMVTWHQGAFEDPRVRLIFDDGRKFIENDNQYYDVVIIDVVDMLDNGPAQALYTRQFYEHLRKRLNPDGVLVIQACEFSFLDNKPHAAISRTLRTIFPQVYSYRVDIPSFLSSWGFIIASDWFHPASKSADEIDRAIEKKLGNGWLGHLTGEYMKSVFSFSKKTQIALAEPGPILEDGVDFVPLPYIEDIKPGRISFPVLPNE